MTCHFRPSELRALALHNDWQAAQDLVLSEAGMVQIPVPTQQQWTNMELDREIQSEYKQVMFQLNNTLSILALTRNNNSRVFLSLHWGRIFAWFLCVADNIAPLTVWITHYDVSSLHPSLLCEFCVCETHTFVARVSFLCFNSIHLGISWPPSVTDADWTRKKTQQKNKKQRKLLQYRISFKSTQQNYNNI